MKATLRKYQIEGIDAVRQAYMRGAKAPLYVLPTGGGKTVVFTHISESASRKEKRVYIIAHRDSIVRQISRHLRALGVDHGCITPNHSMTKHAIQVASVWTLVRRVDKYPEPDMIILDEAHHAAGENTWTKIVRAWPRARILGVTATPCRLDGSGLGHANGGIFDHMILGPTIRELIEMGFLTRPAVYAPRTEIDLSGLKTVGGDYEKGELGRRMDKPTITGSAVEHYRKLAHGVPAIAFCASVDHARHVADQFRANGYRAASLDGTNTDQQRKDLIDALGDGRLDILTSCQIISEGTDIPVVGCVILLRPTQSESLYLQQVGRGLRPYPGKTETIILDHVGNVFVHGMPDDERFWSLEGERRKKRKKKDQEKPIKIKQCPACYAAHHPAPVCPRCGHVYKTQARKLEQRDGELQKVDKNSMKDIEKRRAIATADSLEKLKEVAKKYGYKEYWAVKVWEHRQRKIG